MTSTSSSTATTHTKNDPKSAFDGLALQSSCAEPSTVTEDIPYDVFINHCGPDVKETFAKRIFETLNDTGLKVFLDKYSLQAGDQVTAEIQAAMSSASIHIAIFSQNYVQSPWCLAELSFMLKTGIQIIPVFYHVQPSDLRWADQGKGIYAKSFEDHEKKDRYTSGKLQEWKMALKEVSLIHGYIVNLNDDEGLALKSTMNSVLDKVRKVPLLVAKHLVGLNEAIQDFEKVADESSMSGRAVKVVGIVGMGGSGKTTMATELFNRKHSSFANSTFLFDVKDDGGKKALPGLQKKLLEGLLPRTLENKPFHDVHEGKRIVVARLRSVRVLIVLDDLDHKDQLDALFPEELQLGSGSLIIVTTRDRDVLPPSRISSIYSMKMLSPPCAKDLFCWHAFLGPNSPQEFTELVDKFVENSGRLPLSLKVLGAQLYSKTKDYWESILHEIERILPEEITERLKLSYDALDKEERETFLDVACFFIREKKSLVTAVWDGKSRSGLHSLERLRNKCLVELDGQNRIRMHNHLRDLGKQIASEHSPHRLFSHDHFEEANYDRHAPIRGIMTATTQFVACSAHDEFPRCSSDFQPTLEQCMELLKITCRGLSFLVIKGDWVKEKFAELSRDLVWLRWFDFKHAHIPSWLSLAKLRVLELHGALSLGKLWEDEDQAPLQLRELMITSTWGSSFESFPSSISQLKQLKKIALIGYLGDEFRIKTLPEEFCDLKSLEHLELRHCRALSSLPIGFGKLTRLRHIDLCSCEELRVLPASFNQLKQLEYLDVSHCHKLKLRLNMLQYITTLQNLFLSGCLKLQVLPQEITNQVSLKQLHVEDTRLREFPDAFCELRKLEILKIGSPLLTSLPTSLEKMFSLTRLEIIDSLEMEVLPESLESLNMLENLYLELLGIKSLPKSFGKLANLQTLEISGCPISELHFGSESACSLGNLKVINLSETNVTMISISEGCCPGLETLQLRQNDYLREIAALPSRVKMIELSDCQVLNNIRGVYGLSNLQNLEISGCPELPSDFPEIPCIVRRE
ncbi:hypothetical protein SUGI_0259690 [Cryptomeria japonica]|uniref:disease resistance protein Roq1 n=1 Tax=Cryptomeria japonica TaxID=3369 RepID=UPI002408D224|nr:disease resistance protein Roq1 [Cryptomeria japonica]GLJ15771.1 hypothetical protein SUGI_0259690 [Cryptomeria japonica]